jgi:hypothetical protein
VDGNPVDRAICTHHQQVNPKQRNVVGHQLSFAMSPLPVRLRGCLASVPTWAPVLACEGKLGRATFFSLVATTQAGRSCVQQSQAGFMRTCALKKEKGSGRKKRKWQVPMGASNTVPCPQQSGEISRVCVCPCDVLQRVKWAASWPSSRAGLTMGALGGRVHGTCQRYNAVSIMSVRVYPTARVVVVVVLSVDIPCISSMPQAQFDICAFHPTSVSWMARE